LPSVCLSVCLCLSICLSVYLCLCLSSSNLKIASVVFYRSLEILSQQHESTEGRNAVEIETERDSDDVTEDPHDEQPSINMFRILIHYSLHSLAVFSLELLRD